MMSNSKLTIICILSSLLLCHCSASKAIITKDSSIVEVAPWQYLFNGKNLDGWTVKVHHYESGDNHANTFRVEDEIIKVRYDEYKGEFNDRFSHLYYDTPLSYYHLSMEYRFVGEIHPGTPSYAIKNSGIMFHSQAPHTMLKEQDWPISVEMQFLAGIEQGKNRPTGNMCSPGTSIVYAGKLDERHCINSSSETLYGDQWVKADLVVLGDSLVQHYINDKLVMEYSKPQIGGGVANRYDPQYKVDGKLLTQGHIALQSEGQPIDFKNVKLMNLEGCMDNMAINYGSHFKKSKPEDCKYKR